MKHNLYDISDVDFWDIAEYSMPMGDDNMRNVQKLFCDGVNGKNIRKPSKIKHIRVLAAALAAIMITTVSVGAANDWNFSELITRYFSSNSKVIDNMQSETYYEVLSNTFGDGFTFEVSGLYADDGDMFVAVDIISDEPVFTQNRYLEGLTWVGVLDDMPFAFPKGFHSSELTYQRINDNTITAFFLFKEPSNIITAGDKHTLSITDIVYVTYTDDFEDFERESNGNIIRNKIAGTAEIKFTVNELALNSCIELYPNVLLDSGSTITKIKINPFSISIHYDNDNEPFLINEPLLKMKDGRILNTASGIGIGFGGMGTYDDDGNWFTNVSIKYDKTLNVDDIEAIIYEDIEIPVA